MADEDLRYPVGKFQPPTGPLTADERRRYIDEIADAPAKLRAAVNGLSEAQLNEPYRSGGWSVRQVAHHVTDSHINSYVRFRLSLTEDAPPIKGYDENLWAELPDAKTAAPELSLDLMEPLHKRWVALLKTMTEDQWARTFTHSEYGQVRLDRTLALYAWHGRHHTAHVTRLRERKGW